MLRCPLKKRTKTQLILLSTAINCFVIKKMGNVPGSVKTPKG